MIYQTNRIVGHFAAEFPSKRFSVTKNSKWDIDSYRKHDIGVHVVRGVNLH